MPDKRETPGVDAPRASTKRDRRSVEDGTLAAAISVDEAPRSGPAPGPSRVQSARPFVREPRIATFGLLQDGPPSPMAGGQSGSASGSEPAAGGPKGRRLGKNTKHVHTAAEDASDKERRETSKRDRYRLLHLIWDDSDTIDRIAKCRRVSVVAGGDVGLRVEGGAAGYSGLARCGSVWACPCCAAKIARVRADEIGRLLTWATRNGHTVGMLTLTLQHHAGQRLDDTWTAASESLRDLRRSRAWRSESEREYGIRLGRWEVNPRRRPRPVRRLGWLDRLQVLGTVRLVEVTYGGNGWHPHVHLLVIFKGPVSQGLAEESIKTLFPAWQRALNKRGYDALERWRNPDGSEGGALDIRVSTDAVRSGLEDYFTKSLALEMTHSVTKTGNKAGAGLSPFMLAKSAYFDGDADHLDAWHEWMQSSRGRQQLVWSDGLKDLIGVEERADEEIADEEIGTDDQLILPADTWRAIRYLQVDLLLVAEAGGIHAARAWLDGRGLAWLQPDPEPSRDRMEKLIKKRAG